MKKDINEKEKMLTDLLAQAQDHPLVVRIRTEKEAEVLAKRQEAAAKIALLQKEQEETLPKLRAELKAKETKYIELRAALDAALNEVKLARASLYRENLQLQNRIEQEKVLLYETAWPEIQDAMNFFYDKLEFLRSPGRISWISAGAEINVFTDTKKVNKENNVPAILSAVAYGQNALAALEQMKLIPSLDVQIIEKMKKEIPDINIFTDAMSEHPLAGSTKSINPRDLLPSDGAMNYKIGKLNEKFNDLMFRKPRRV